MLKTSLILVIVSVVGISSACSAAGKDGSGSTAGRAQNQTAENNQTDTKETPKTDSTKPADIFAAFKQGDDYKTMVRPKILKDGWQPARSESGNENCKSGAAAMCQEYPELDAGPAARLGNIVFRWTKGDKVLLIYTVDGPPVYEKYEFEKSPKQSNEPDVLGKYECCEIGISGERTLELKAKNIVIFNERDEGSTAAGSGSWRWDANKKFINVELTVKQELDDGGNSETKTSKVTFQLKKVGEDLKIVRETLSSPGSNGYYIGETFKKQ